MNLADVQEQLKEMGIDGWLLYDFQGLNPIAKKLVGLQGALLTRRWYFWVPKQGDPSVLCHQIEQHGFSRLGAQILIFKSWKEMIDRLQQVLEGHKTIAMEYSPLCSIPYVSRVDAGTVETIRNLGKEVVSSANLVQYFEARWSEEQFEMHLEASRLLMQILFETFREIGDVNQRIPLTEYSVQQSMLEKYRRNRLESFSPPIVGVNQNSGNPHYEPTKESSKSIQKGDFILLDFWAKLARPNSVYADYTWVAFVGESIPDKIQNVWEIVRGARDAAIDFVTKNYSLKTDTRGWEVDSIARDFITEKGYGDYFIHRTGHNIGQEDHGNGANMDSLETKDERLLIPKTCFSIEPGIYLPDFGIRSEVNVYLSPTEAVVTGDPVQTQIFKIGSK